MTDQNFAEHPDVIGHRLVELGHVSNLYLLDANGALDSKPQDQMPWNLPSRVMQFPIIIGKTGWSETGTPVERAVSLIHPEVKRHPFVTQVETDLGLEIDYLSGSDVQWRNQLATWWHAVDLVSNGQLENLLQTRQFTTDEDIAGAIGFGLRYGPADSGSGGHVTLKRAREVLEILECPCPDDIDRLLLPFEKEHPGSQGGINLPGGEPAANEAWALILGIERGLLTYRGRYLRWERKADARQPCLF